MKTYIKSQVHAWTALSLISLCVLSVALSAHAQVCDPPLSLGTEGEDVTLLQRLLNTAGFTVAPPPEAGSPGNETSYYGQLTATAIKTLQCEKGIVCEGTPASTGFGTVGPKTLTLLNSLLSEFKGLTLNLQKGQTLDLQGRTLIDPRSQLAQIAPTSNLVAHYTFDDQANPGRDDSNSGNNGTLTPVAPNGPTWVIGTDAKVGSGLSFDGADDQINIPDSPSLTDLPNGAFSVSAWVNRTNSAGNNDYVVSKSHNSAPNGWNVSIDGARRATLVVQRATTDMKVRSGLNTTPASGWFHVVVVYAGGDTAANSKIYIN